MFKRDLTRWARGVGLGGLTSLTLLSICSGVRSQVLLPAGPSHPLTSPSAKSVERIGMIPSESPEGDPLLAPRIDRGRVLRDWQQALQLIRRQSPVYLQQLEATRRAQAQARQAWATVLPTLNGQVGYGHQFMTDKLGFGSSTASVPVQDSGVLLASLDWALLDMRRYFAIDSAELNISLNERAGAELERQLTSSLLNAMLATLATQRMAVLSRDGLRAALERARLTESKLRYGQGTTLDVARAQQDVSATRGELVNADESVRQAEDALGLLLGLEGPVSISDALSPERLKAAIVAGCHMARSIEDRPDVATARRGVELADRKVREAWLQLLPTLSLHSQVEHNTEVTYGPKTMWSISAMLSIPFYDGGARYGQIAEAQSNARSARAALTSSRLQALVSVTQATRAVSVRAATLKVAEQQRALAEQVDASTRTAYADGFATSLDLVVSGQALRQTQNAATLASVQLAQAQVEAVLSHAECRL